VMLRGRRAPTRLATVDERLVEAVGESLRPS
jgi:hypothetical protein